MEINLTPKLKYFAWKFIHNSRLTRKQLKDIGLNATVECPFCQKEDDNLNHLFKTYDFTSIIRSTINLNCTDPNNSNLSIIDWL